MCLYQVWNESHKVLNQIRCFVREIQISLALFKGELIATLVSLVGLTISSSDLVVLFFCASLSKLLLSITLNRTSKSKGFSKI
jgi:hypothetical protein